ncbi:MAG TPA: hypothetical protein VFR41_02495 [Acidimicrobiia bacterium]|nr:hypothetical protein [Acidimicrobiia bacterium]
MTVFAATGASVTSYDDIDAALAAARKLAAAHLAVGIDIDEPGAGRMALRALPGMIVCPRDFEGVDCYPLTAVTALVSGSSSRSPEARTLRSTTPRARPLAPITS